MTKQSANKQLITNNRGRIAMTAMLDLAQRQLAGETTPLTIDYFSKAGNVSASYLEMIFADLRRAKLVKSMRGPNGGYILARDPFAITMLEVINATTQRTLSAGGNYIWSRLEMILRMEMTAHSLGSIANFEAQADEKEAA